MEALIIIALAISGLIVMLWMLLKSKDDVDFKVNIKRGEMNLRKRKQLRSK